MDEDLPEETDPPASETDPSKTKATLDIDIDSMLVGLENHEVVKEEVTEESDPFDDVDDDDLF